MCPANSLLGETIIQMGGAIAKVTRPKMLFMARPEDSNRALGVKSPFLKGGGDYVPRRHRQENPAHGRPQDAGCRYSRNRPGGCSPTSWPVKPSGIRCFCRFCHSALAAPGLTVATPGRASIFRFARGSGRCRRSSHRNRVISTCCPSLASLVPRRRPNPVSRRSAPGFRRFCRSGPHIGIHRVLQRLARLEGRRRRGRD